jgi:hypothetical protein
MELQATCTMTVLLICGDGMPHLQQKEIILTKENKSKINSVQYIGMAFNLLQ